MQNGKGGLFFLGICIVLAAAVFGWFFYASRPSANTIRTTGLAVKSVESDLIKWRITISRTVAPEEMRIGYLKLGEDLKNFRTVMSRAGITDSEISVQPVNPQPVYNNTGVIKTYMLNQPLFVLSTNVEAVEKVAFNPSPLLEQGMMIQYANVEYFPSKLPELKRELLGAATEDARKRAEEIAAVSGQEIKRLVSARAGVFQITEPYSAEVSGMGMYNTATKKKDISVTVNAVYEMD